MPGIFDAESTSTDQSDSSSAASSSGNQDETTTSEETPVREITQTDRINKFLLKSCLDHINTNPINAQNESEREASNIADNDWN